MTRRCDICGCSHDEKILVRCPILYLKGSQDDFICERCRLELVHFAHSLQAVADKVRTSEIELVKSKQKEQ